MIEPKPRRRWFRFSLRSLMLLVVLIAVPIGLKTNQVRNQRLVVAEIESLGGHVMWAYEPSRSEPPGPNWLRRLLGDDFFAEIYHVTIDNPGVTDETIGSIAELPNLCSLYFESDAVTDEGVARI